MSYNSYFLKFAKYEMLLSGTWPIENCSKLLKILYKSYGWVTQVNFLYFLVTLIIGFLMAISNLTKTQEADCIIYILSYSISFWKVWLIQGDSIKEIMSKVDKLEIRIGIDNDLYEIYRKNARFNFKLCSIQPILLSICYVLFIFVFIGNLKLWNELEAQGLESNRVLIYPQWFPFYQPKWFIVIMQMFNGLWGGICMMVSDGFIGTLMYFISTDLSILGKELEQFGIDEIDNIDRRSKLRSLILRHKAIISDVGILNKTFGWVFFLEFTLKSFHMSQILFAISEIKQIDVAGTFKVCELLVVFSQFTVLYYQANNVILESGNLSDSIYNSQWMDQPMEIIRCLLIIMIRAKKTLKFEAFGLVILSNTLTVKIIQAVISYIVFAT